MTDKEIIIDGIDVSECGYYYEIDSQCNIFGMGKNGEDTFCRYCTDNPNCYYKKLKLLEQENERLQKLTCFNCGEETLSPSGSEIYDKILVYKQTLQEIKAIAEFHITQADSEDVQEDMKQIIDLITKAESEEE